MRRFYSYGPVGCRYHFCVPHQALVEQCLNQTVDGVTVSVVAIGWV